MLSSPEIVERRARWRALGALACVLCATSPALAADPLDALLAEFARIESFEAKFKEEKRIALLVEPLVNEGTLHYERPDRFARHVIAPEQSSLVVIGDKVLAGTKRKHETFSRGSNPMVGKIVDAYIGLTSGDRKRLEGSFVVAFDGSVEKKWTLRLTPRDARLARIVSSIEFRGAGRTLDTLTVTEASGDVSTTTFSSVRMGAKPAASESAKAFALP